MGNGKSQKFSTAVLVRGSIDKQIRFSTPWDWVNEELLNFKGNLISAEISLTSGEKFRVVSVYSPAWPIFDRQRGLPPILIQAGANEILLDDSVRFNASAKNASVDVTLEIWPGMWHDWHTSVPTLREAKQAIDQIGEFVEEHIPSGMREGACGNVGYGSQAEGHRETWWMNH